MESSARSLVARAALHVVAPLMLGVGVYASCRAAKPVALAFAGRWAPASRFPEITGVAPDAAWSYALAAAVALIWRDAPGAPRRLWCLAAVALACGWELGQLAGVVPGTFDRHDLLASFAASVAAALLSPR